MSVVAPWMDNLKNQQQAVILLALRGPDGQPKRTLFKDLLRPYRATVLKAAKYNRLLTLEDKGDDFMSFEEFRDPTRWKCAIISFLSNESDAAILHHYTHFMHGAEILGYKHPDPEFKYRWHMLYLMFVDALHLNRETEEQMDARLSDWDGRFY